MDKFSYISNADVNFIDDLYNKFKNDPQSVDTSWQRFFEGFEFSQEKFGSNGAETEESADSVRQHFSERNWASET
jgi:2-oxoglutarate dehydrogenase E1 component